MTKKNRLKMTAEELAEIERELHRLWGWLRDLHEAGRPRNAVPPGRPDAAPVTLP